jgi:queuine tRNA-ribosyltransferase
MSRLQFVVEGETTGSQARVGRFQTRHGAVQTPVFMPVGTRATVKGQTVETLKVTGATVLLANTYHLLLRPGPDVFRKFGGIHRFMNWDGPVLTDSGGFQIFSLPHSRAMTEEGAHFISYVDGAPHLLSPETSIEMQQAIGSDIMMVLDQCIDATAPYDQAKAAMELTHRWAVRSLQARSDPHQALFGIVQGACHPELRRHSAGFLGALPFDGLAIGGLAVGETRPEREEFTGLVTALLPRHLPRYLMGVGTPIDILEAVHRGVDMFDCIIPSQHGHRGIAFTSHGKLQFRRTVYRLADEPIDAACPCQACRSYSRAYLHHLVKAEEPLAWHLLTTHNMTFYHRLMADIRQNIRAGTFRSWYETMREELIRTDEGNPVRVPRRPRTRRSPRLGDYEVHRSAQGFSSIRQISSGEVMHSVNCPTEEARRLYIEQSRLAARLTEHSSIENELLIWDVGLGAASNAMAAVRCFEDVLAQRGNLGLRPMRLISFERDLAPLRLACREMGSFPHLHHAAPAHILQHGFWEHPSKALTWTLQAGDFRDFYGSAGLPKLIFYDPFSAETDAILWTADTFADLHTHCRDADTELYTYSAATAVRVALLRAGFFLAAGIGTGPKSETTIAFSSPDGPQRHPAQPELLGSRWLERWRRSDAKVPKDLTAEARQHIERQIEDHPQFRI